MEIYFHLLLISMLPLIELRGAMIYAAMSRAEFLPSLAISVLGNLLPVPFLIRFSKQVLTYLSGSKRFGGFAEKIINHGNRKAEKVRNLEMLGLFLFVALPVPGTGAWTASLIAALLQLRIVKSFFVIAAGVVTCGIIMGILSFGLTGLIK
ncbi:MAG TPA: small multi-drug export protein [Oscillospiraceae bacterium]|nr:small multi-drug export protein [Oscillospiraceae bacterium]HRW57917.1 small multi-drug export protein [Oscillospiraceae bacterium]